MLFRALHTLGGGLRPAGGLGVDTGAETGGLGVDTGGWGAERDDFGTEVIGGLGVDRGGLGAETGGLGVGTGGTCTCSLGPEAGL